MIEFQSKAISAMLISKNALLFLNWRSRFQYGLRGSVALPKMSWAAKHIRVEDQPQRARMERGLEFRWTPLFAGLLRLGYATAAVRGNTAF